LGPGHADPAPRAHLAAEGGIVAAPGSSAETRVTAAQLARQELAHFLAQRLGTCRRRGRGGEGKCLRSVRLRAIGFHGVHPPRTAFASMELCTDSTAVSVQSLRARETLYRV